MAEKAAAWRYFLLLAAQRGNQQQPNGQLAGFLL
jgi:hypothetical protein